MIDHDAAEKAMSAFKRRTVSDPPDYTALYNALEAYEAARPKPVTITGLPETLPDGRKIVGWSMVTRELINPARSLMKQPDAPELKCRLLPITEPV